MKHQIGIMQGRLTQPKGRGIQFFPFDNWENEFFSAQKIGLEEIEFIFDYDKYTQNPLWTKEGIETIRELKKKTGIQVNVVCFDYFMRRPFYKSDLKEQSLIKKENTEILEKVLLAMKELEIGLIEIPLVDASSLKNNQEKLAFQEWLLGIVDREDTSIRFGLETDLKPKDFLEYIEGFCNPRVGANYDSGNSSGIGYDLYEEVTTLRDHIFNIHIKDRVYQGTTVPLGTGSADFEQLFKGLSEIGYSHNFILQAARGDEGKEEDNISAQMKFVCEYIEKYNV
ncbi:sugar phosphate isomerase/epimerase [bacterium D16-54]|nr:sugar phosphate isomerase/epimerase [bacterium D16-54]